MVYQTFLLCFFALVTQTLSTELSASGEQQRLEVSESGAVHKPNAADVHHKTSKLEALLRKAEAQVHHHARAAAHHESRSQVHHEAPAETHHESRSQEHHAAPAAAHDESWSQASLPSAGLAEQGKSEAKLKARVAVSSHASLGQSAGPGLVSAMQGSTGVSRTGRSCSDVYAKAQSLLQYINGHLYNQLVSPANESLTAAMEVFISNEQGQLAYKKILDALSLQSMWNTLQSGNVWTSMDHQDFHALCTGILASGSSYLEEYPATAPDALFHSPIYQGDMAIENEPRPQLGLPPFASSLWPSPPPPPRSTVIPVGASITYCYSAAIEMYDKDTIWAFELAVADVQAQIYCMQFVRGQADILGKTCTNYEGPVVPSILVTNDSPGCWSHFGMVSGMPSSPYEHISQILNLGTGCALKGMALHQLGHALGLSHMTTRSDRDQYISFLNTPPLTVKGMFPLALWFDNSTDQDYGFDLLSVMLSNSFPFDSTTETPTAIPSKEYGLHIYMGQRQGFSEGDVIRLGSLYGCYPETVQPHVPTQTLVQLFAQGTGMAFDGTCMNAGPACDELQHTCYDPTLGPQVRQGCAVSCLTCVQAPPEAIKEWELINQQQVATQAAAQAAAVLACKDQLDTGIMFADGQLALCSDLANYCKHATMGKKVTSTCAKTCGNCPVFGQAVSREESMMAVNCLDSNETALPVFLLGGVQQACADLWQFCHGHMDSEFIQQKCPATCGTCNGDPVVKPPQKFYVPDTETGLKSADGTCDRRRRWGFCMNRRRRNDGQEPADP